jgi:hypothetical protein
MKIYGIAKSILGLSIIEHYDNDPFLPGWHYVLADCQYNAIQWAKGRQTLTIVTPIN